jgi:hypothetical protein
MEETDRVNGTGWPCFSLSQINLAASEVTEFALHLYNIPAIPLADPTLIIGRLTARRKNGCRKVKDALPLGARAHGCAPPASGFHGRSRARNRSCFAWHRRGGHGVVFEAVFIRVLEHELGWYFLA